MKYSRMLMWCYNPNSESGKMLANKLDIYRIKHENSSFYGTAGDVILNWGSSSKTFGVRGDGKYRVLNAPQCVSLASNKINFFEQASEGAFDAMQAGLSPNVRTVPWTCKAGTALAWLKNGATVIGRQKVEGMGGEGIVIMEKPVDFTECKLYTKYIEKDLEFRVYVVGGKVIDFCQKKRKLDETPTNWKIRSRDNGFVFCWPNTDLPDDCATQAINSVAACGLDFGGVDIIVERQTKGQAGFGKAYVLEVNTAPWLSEYTAELMAKAINEELLAA